jgi:hypothetical protein
MVMLRRLRAVLWVLVPAAVLLVLPACAEKRTRRSPIPLGSVASGEGTLAAVRTQLEGTWNLVSAELVSASGQRTALRGTAVLTYDAYGNLSLKSTYVDPAATADQKAVLNYSGRAVIDVQQQVLHLLSLQESEGDFAKLPPEMLARRDRAYAFDGDLLTLTIKDASGRVTAVTTWRKQTR